MNPVRRWRPYIRGFSLVLGWLATAAAAQSGGYFRQIDDLPLMQGLSEVAGAGLAFDKPEGRIVEAYAEGAVSVSAVEAFYAKSLPELGWTKSPPTTERTTWQRENELLEFDLIRGPERLRIHILLTPE